MGAIFAVKPRIIDDNGIRAGVIVEVWAVSHEDNGPVATAITGSDGRVDIFVSEESALSFYGGVIPERFFLRVTASITVFEQPHVFTLGDSMIDVQLPSELDRGFFLVGDLDDDFDWEITGRHLVIQLTDGNPLAGIPVQCTPGGTVVADGYGIVVLRFHDDDGKTVNKGRIRTLGFSAPITIPTAYGSISTSQIEVPTAELTLFVRNTNNVGIAGATVELIDDEHMNQGTLRSQISNGVGRIVFKVTPSELVTFYKRDATRHRIRVYKNGLIYDSNIDPSPATGFFSDGVWTLFDEDTSGDLTIIAAAQFLDVAVVDQYGAPVLDAVVDVYLSTATDLDADIISSNSTEKLGLASFRLFVPSPATTSYFFRIRRSGKNAVVTRRADINNGFVAFGTDGYFTTTLSPGKSTLTIDVDAVTSMVVEGRILDDDGNLIEGLQVNLAQLVDGQPRFTGATNEDGYFSIVVSKSGGAPFEPLRVFVKDDSNQAVIITDPSNPSTIGGWSSQFLELRTSNPPSGSSRVTRTTTGTLNCSTGTSSGIRIDCFDDDHNGAMVASVVTRANGLFLLKWTEPSNRPAMRQMRFLLFDGGELTKTIDQQINVESAFTLNVTGRGTVHTALSSTSHTIANLSPYQFLATAGPDFDDDFLVYKAAVAESIFVRYAGTGILLEAQSNSGELRRCQSCSSLMSRSAYILELVAFCDRTFGGSLNGLTALEDALRQPLAGLSICDEGSVNQARVAVEVLRKDFDINEGVNRATFASSEAAVRYRRHAYEDILADLGTNTDELREAASGNGLVKTRVARVLGVNESDVASLYLSEEGGDLTEHGLESLFGLRATENDHNFSLGLPDPVSTLPEPEVVTYRKSELRAGWLSLDAAAPTLVLDPDVVLHSDVISSTASTLLASRRQWVDTKINALLNATGSGDQGRFNAMLLECPPLAGVGGWSVFSTPVLNTIELGEPTDVWLAPVSLSINEFAELQRIWDVCVSPVSVDPDDWREAVNVLLTCAKRSLYPTWKAEEASANVSLSPEFFAIPVEDIPSSSLFFLQSAGRGDATQRREWDSTLRQRTETWEAATTTVTQAVLVSEENNLSGLMDALVATAAETTNQLESRLHIDLSTRGRRRSSRHVLAIETLVSMLERGRRQGGTVNVGNISVAMDIYAFDATWVWLGRYDSWRAAMQVFVYPEELIDPSWRDCGSYSFEVFRQKLLSEPYISPQRGRELFDGYRKLVKAQTIIRVTAAATGTLVQSEERPGRSPLPVAREVTFAIASGRGGSDVSPGGWYLIHHSLETDPRGWQPLPRVLGDPIAVTLRKDEATVFFHRYYSEGDTVAVVFGRDGWEEPVVVCSGSAHIGTSTNPERRPLIVQAGKVGEPVRLARWNGTPLEDDDWHTIETVSNEYLDVTRYGKSPDSFKTLQSSLVQVLESETHINLIYTARGIATARVPVNFQSTTSVQIHVSARYSALVWARVVNQYILDILYSTGSSQRLVRIQAGEAPTNSPASPIAMVLPSGLSLTNTVPTDGPQSLTTLGNGSVDGQKGILKIEFSETGNQFNVVRIQRLSVATTSIGTLLSTRPNMSAEQVETRILRSQDVAVIEKHGGTSANLNAILEWGFWAPLLLARRLTEAGEYNAAWDWMSTIYRTSSDEPWLFPPMVGSNWAELSHDDTAWLARPNDPFAVANLRPLAAQRVTLLAAVDLLQRWGDSLYVSQFAEDVARARNLFALAAQILEDPAATTAPPSLTLTEVDSWMPAGIADNSAALAIRWNLDQIVSITAYNAAVAAVQALLNASGVNINARVANAVQQSISSRIAAQSSGTLIDHEVVDLTALQIAVANSENLVTSLARTLGKTEQAVSIGTSLAMAQTTDSSFLLSPSGASGIRAALVNDAAPFQTTTEVRGTLNAGLMGDQTYIPTPRFGLCVDPPQRLQSLRDSIALRLTLISENLGPTGLRIWDGGQVNSRTSQTTSEFRFEYLISQARQALGAAQQLEASMVSAISQRDEEQFRQLKASQAIELADIAVEIGVSNVTQARAEVVTSQLQTQQASFSKENYNRLRSQGLSKLEREIIKPKSTTGDYILLGLAVGAGVAATILSGGAAAPVLPVLIGAGGQLISGASSIEANSDALSRSQQTQLATFQRREREWIFQEKLSQFNIDISLQQETVGRIRVDTQRLQLSANRLQLQFSIDELNFLQSKESSAEMYAWMVSKLRTYYRNVLLEATALARASHSQLVFQRQTVIPNPIASDYWQDLTDPTSIGRNGIVGSSRLLQDLTELERLARQNTTRRLHVRKVFSMRAFSPDQLLRLQQDGILSFAPRLEDYDVDFPELSHRLIESVTFSVIGLTPSTGIVASVIASGVSKTQTEDGRTDIYVLRPHQGVTFTGIVEQNGISNLNPQNELLRPFEGLGVETEIQLQVPRAANSWDLRSIVDVIISVEYSALKNAQKYQRTVARLASSKTFSPTFSLRDDFVDQWYEVLQSTAAIPAFTFAIEDQDFPSSLSDLTVQQARLVFVEKDDQTLGACDVDLVFNSGPASTANGTGGLFSTRQFGSWSGVVSQNPVGEWVFSLPGGALHPVRQLIDDERLVDIVLILEVEATTPAWPETL